MDDEPPDTCDGDTLGNHRLMPRPDGMASRSARLQATVSMYAQVVTRGPSTGRVPSEVSHVPLLGAIL